MPKRRAISSTAPNCFFPDQKGVFLSRSQVKYKGFFLWISIPFSSARSPRKRSIATDYLIKFREDQCQCIFMAIAFLMKVGHQIFVFACSVQQLGLLKFVLEECIQSLDIIGYFAEQRGFGDMIFEDATDFFLKLIRPRFNHRTFHFLIFFHPLNFLHFFPSLFLLDFFTRWLLFDNI